MGRERGTRKGKGGKGGGRGREGEGEGEDVNNYHYLGEKLRKWLSLQLHQSLDLQILHKWLKRKFKKGESEEGKRRMERERREGEGEGEKGGRHWRKRRRRLPIENWNDLQEGPCVWRKQKMIEREPEDSEGEGGRRGERKGRWQS